MQYSKSLMPYAFVLLTLVGTSGSGCRNVNTNPYKSGRDIYTNMSKEEEHFQFELNMCTCNDLASAIWDINDCIKLNENLTEISKSYPKVKPTCGELEDNLIATKKYFQGILDACIRDGVTSKNPKYGCENMVRECFVGHLHDFSELLDAYPEFGPKCEELREKNNSSGK